jgi:threonine aldolase
MIETGAAPSDPRLIDLRSDTVTRPTAGMRHAMAEAEVGDDVFGEDPSVAALEQEVARLTGKEAALFVPSGTMGNQLAVACQTRPGDEVIVGEGAHLAFYEVGAAAALSGVQLLTAGSAGFFSADEMLERVKPDAYFYPRTALVALENTHNRGGGAVLPQIEATRIADAARARGIASHLDGARIWNASVASGLPVAELARPFDTISVCFSKGLGAPVGSALAGSRSLVDRARRFRKMWGGGMRQAGILAAGALYALAHHRARLVDDHAHARAFAERMAAVPGVKIDLAQVVTNIVNVGLPAGLASDDVARVAREVGVALNATGPGRLRVVTHLDVSREDVLTGADRLARAIARVRDASTPSAATAPPSR